MHEDLHLGLAVVAKALVAVLDNVVEKESAGDYQTTSEGGVIIYTYGNKAAWSNGGVLYKIESKAPLNHGQLLKIASSL